MIDAKHRFRKIELQLQMSHTYPFDDKETEYYIRQIYGLELFILIVLIIGLG